MSRALRFMLRPVDLLATCRLHNINPYTWLKDVLIRMPGYDVKNLVELLPQNWKKPENPLEG
jgi:transposase